ncbi:hypothetical protein [Shimia aestuarii]|uniref:Uncharacterized protein n=1 Tax=Shimia aestuarii TaxID=254406 RepID=A0A1I4PTI8_9RHOB|nr:hypothetical protein [Shimia aestuarii]SFM30876.1 hypothetical protein SAMN04488042_10617 [Shimia aestuarii]
MRVESHRTSVRYILDNYPDCPQRDMALNILRKGNVDLAEAWLDALDEMIAKGQSALAADDTKVRRSTG